MCLRVLHPCVHTHGNMVGVVHSLSVLRSFFLSFCCFRFCWFKSLAISLSRFASTSFLCRFLSKVGTDGSLVICEADDRLFPKMACLQALRLFLASLEFCSSRFAAFAWLSLLPVCVAMASSRYIMLCTVAVRASWAETATEEEAEARRRLFRRFLAEASPTDSAMPVPASEDDGSSAASMVSCCRSFRTIFIDMVVGSSGASDRG
mmetsp:Transcript_11549/g.27130  ORF Transcript_11549/g.27130 Transcript_11549/m.27130 type:complete len:206 (-) Transcript_11549:162-779(-)